MSDDVHWSTAAITKARQGSGAVPDALWTQVEALLRGKFSERQLPSGELTTVAKALIAGMVSTPPKVKGPQ